MVDPNAKPNDNSQPVIQILIVLVVILSLLLVMSVVGIGLLVAWSWNADDKPAIQPTVVVAESTNEPPNDFAEPSRKQTNKVADTKQHGDTLDPLPANFEQNKASRNNPLEYKLDREEPLSYDYSYGLNLEDHDITRNGRITYQFLNDDPLKYLTSVLEEEESEDGAEQPFSLSGNGTGFVVHPDGLLATCAHVVEGVESVQVKLEDKVYPGVVIERDLKNDLALIKVDTKQPLPYLKLASETPNLGSAARVFGFPLTDKLGRSMKLTTGTVTGRDEVNASTRLQLDATANPGNSGGPVTNNDGVVLGVVDSILAGGNVADLSFAVPVDELRKLLSLHSVPFSSDTDSGNKNAVSDLDEVSKAVAMIEVSGEQLSKSWKVIAFSITSRLRTTPKNLRSPFQIPRTIPSSTIKGKLVINSRGKVIHSSESQILPGIVQDLSSIGFSELPAAAKERWSNEEQLLVRTETTERQPERSRDPFGMHFGHYPHLRRTPFGSHFSPFGEPPAREVTKQSIRTVNVSDEFEIQSKNPKYEIQHSRKISSRDIANNMDKDSSTFRGALTFDRELGVAESGELKGHIKKKIDGERSSVRVTYSWRKVSDKKLNAEKRKRSEAIAKAKERRRKEQEKKDKKFEELDELAGEKAGFRDFKFAFESSDDQIRNRAETPRVFARIPKESGQGKVAISPNGTVIAIGQFDGATLYAMNQKGSDYERLGKLGDSRDRVSGCGLLKFCGNGKRLLVGERLGESRVYEVGKARANLIAKFKDGKAVAISEDGNFVALYSERKRRLMIVDLETNENMLDEVDMVYDLPVHDAQFSADGKQLLLAQGTRSAVVDIENREVVATCRWQFDRKPRHVTFAGAGRYLLGNQDTFDVVTGKRVALSKHDDDCFAICGAGIWFVHIAEKFNKNLQFHKVDGSTKYQIDAGADSGHWDSIAIAENTNRVVAFETFSDFVFVIDF